MNIIEFPPGNSETFLWFVLVRLPKTFPFVRWAIVTNSVCSNFGLLLNTVYHTQIYYFQFYIMQCPNKLFIFFVCVSLICVVFVVLWCLCLCVVLSLLLATWLFTHHGSNQELNCEHLFSVSEFFYWLLSFNGAKWTALLMWQDYEHWNWCFMVLLSGTLRWTLWHSIMVTKIHIQHILVTK
jgi:hypothetical protein